MELFLDPCLEQEETLTTEKSVCQDTAPNAVSGKVYLYLVALWPEFCDLRPPGGPKPAIAACGFIFS